MVNQVSGATPPTWHRDGNIAIQWLQAKFTALIMRKIWRTGCADWKNASKKITNVERRRKNMMRVQQQALLAIDMATRAYAHGASRPTRLRCWIAIARRRHRNGPQSR